MKVSEAIRMLSDHYSPDDELVIQWWDLEWFELSGVENITAEAVAHAEEELNENDFLMGLIGETLTDYVEQYKAEKEGE